MEKIMDDFLATIKQEGEPAFPEEKNNEESKSVPPASPAENTDKKGEPSPGDAPKEGESTANTENKNVPFHKHPRWIEREKELEELRKVKDDYAKFKSEMEKKVSQFESSSDATSVPEWFKELYGDNPSAWEKYNQYELNRRRELKEEVFRDMQEAQAQNQREAEYWKAYTDREIAKLQGEGKSFDRNEFLKFLVEYQPIGQDGLISFSKGYELFEKMKSFEGKNKSDAKKTLAGMTDSKDKEVGKINKDFLTSHDLRGKSWTSL